MNDINHEYTNEIVCPHCGAEWSDSWECANDYGEEECDECEKKFSYNRDVEVTYSTSKIKD